MGDIVATGDVSYGGTVIQLLDDGGATMVIDDIEELGEVEAMFYYVDAKTAAALGVTAGWYQQDDDNLEFCQNDRVIPMGQGFMVENNDGEVSLTFAGEVLNVDLEVELHDAFNFTGNATPKDITMGDLIASGDVTYGGTVIQLLDDGGATMIIDDIEELGEVEAMFYFVDAKTASALGVTPGWYHQDDDSLEFCQNGRIITAGSGFMIENNDGEVSVTIPSALK